MSGNNFQKWYILKANNIYFSIKNTHIKTAYLTSYRTYSARNN